MLVLVSCSGVGGFIRGSHINQVSTTSVSQSLPSIGSVRPEVVKMAIANNTYISPNYRGRGLVIIFSPSATTFQNEQKQAHIYMAASFLPLPLFYARPKLDRWERGV